MALSSKSLFVYGIEITTLNRNIDFKISGGGDELTAVLDLGFYSPQTLAQEIALQLQTIDSANIYTVSLATNVAGGTQNRITISTNGTYLDLLFATGTNALTSAASVMGFNSSDYTGDTTYTGSSTVGTTLSPTYLGYNYLDEKSTKKVFGAVNVSASGLKEAVTFNIQEFLYVEFRYEAKDRLGLWENLFNWLIQQKPFDFIPEISDPTTFYSVTLEMTEFDSKGLGYQMREMLPDFPNFYQTGRLQFRIIPSSTQFL